MSTTVTQTTTTTEPDMKSQVENRPSWGRTTEFTLWTRIGSAVGICCCPIWSVLVSMFESGELNLSYLPKPSWTGSLMYIGWLLFQAMLYVLLPGRTSSGQRTPAGHLLRYKTNGLMAWVLTHLLFCAGVHQGWFRASVIARNWEGLFVAANVYGYVLAIFAFWKAHRMPSHARDRKFSGSLIHDFWMGIELNPRIGSEFDIKLFHNGRPGIVGWTLIDISFAAQQIEIQGYMSNSMLVVIFFHALYALDFFANEDWYLRTMDITHDHFGMMLAWGDAVFLPSFYTLQTQYLARYPTMMTNTNFCITLAVGVLAYVIFRSANEQKNHVRETKGETNIWGKPATYIECEYQTSDKKQHKSLLLTCGWWSEARHINYTADMLLSFAMCSPCAGRGKLLPWSYFLYLCVLLVHRVWRDEDRCAVKYGERWREYCQAVPWRLIPYVY